MSPRRIRRQSRPHRRERFLRLQNAPGLGPDGDLETVEKNAPRHWPKRRSDDRRPQLVAHGRQILFPRNRRQLVAISRPSSRLGSKNPCRPTITLLDCARRSKISTPWRPASTSNPKPVSPTDRDPMRRPHPNGRLLPGRFCDGPANLHGRSRRQTQVRLPQLGHHARILAAPHLGICSPEKVVEWLEYPCYSNLAGPACIPSRWPTKSSANRWRLIAAMIVPKGPGLGIEIDERIIEKYPLIPGPWSFFRIDSRPKRWPSPATTACRGPARARL